MYDVLFLAILIAFFAATFGLIHLCRLLQGTKP